MSTGQAATRTATDRDAMLRRVAIVLSSLPASMGAKLLGNMDPQSKQALRRTMTSLSDVDPLERRRAIEAFKVSLSQQPAQGASGSSAAGGLDAALGQTAQTGQFVQGTSVLKSASFDGQDSATSPLGFLNQVTNDDLATLLAQEHPQAIAIVMASVEPSKAGQVLPLLPEHLRSVTLSRIGRLGEVTPETASDLASHFQNQINRSGIRSQSERGKQRVEAILASMPASESSSSMSPTTSPTTALPANPTATDRDAGFVSASPMADSVGHSPTKPMPVGDAPHPQQETTATEVSVGTAGRSEAEVSAIDLSHRLQVVNSETSTRELPASEPASDSTGGLSGEPSLVSTDEINRHLISLTPMELCQSLGKVDTKDAMLTLCGLPNQNAEAALAILPKDQAKMVRIKMANLNTLNLRDIDDAKERVANASLSIESVATRIHNSRSGTASAVAA